MSDDILNGCRSDLEFYSDHYLSNKGMKSFSIEQRLDYLEKLKAPCFDLQSAIIYRANALFEMNKHTDAIMEIDRGLKLWPNQKGNLLLSKVDFLYALKFYNVDIPESYQDLINLLKIALKSGNETPHRVHLTWAEIAIQIGDKTGDYDEAVEHVIMGNNIKSAYRFYTLLSIISERLGEYEKSVSFISDVVRKEATEEYLYEADTVLSLTKSLCALGEEEKAMLVVEKAIKVNETQRNNPLIQESARFVLNSCFEAKVNIKQ